jgi:pyruvate/2-oxoglutarate dehydrogenase complex dihydrolipoamide dehydrogenase (E3) component
MTQPTRSDVIVIGTGQAGVPLAVRLAAAGKTVVIAERAAFGGTCINYGCTPTKTMIASARAAHVARTCGRLGVHVPDVRVDLAAVVARKDDVVKQWRESVERRLHDAGQRLRVVHGQARFVGPHEVDIASERFVADTIVTDVGARPAVPALPGLDTVPWLDNRRAMDLRNVPEHLIVVGGGYVGCELGQMFRRFGSEVTVLQRGSRLLTRAEPEAADELARVFLAEGIHVKLGATVESVAPSGGGIMVRVSGGVELRGSHLLLAVGRRPNTDDLGCEAAGLKLNARGYIETDDAYRTSVPGVYAVGDCDGGPQFTHTSWDDHRILFDLLLGRTRKGAPHGRSGRVIPAAVFTDPQVATVGMTEAEARAHGVAHEIATMPFGWIARALETDEKAGVLKVLVDPATERVLGATIVGAEAGELIHIFAVLMQARAPAWAIVDVEIAHPTFAEGVQAVLMKLKRYALT